MAENVATNKARTTATAQTNPVILDLGRRKRKQVKDLTNGSGKLLDEVLDAVDELRAAGTIAQDAHPVIVVVREKPKGNGILPMLDRLAR